MNLCDVVEYLLRMRSLPGSERDANWLFTRRLVAATYIPREKL